MSTIYSAQPPLFAYQPVDIQTPVRDTNTIVARTLTNPDVNSPQVLWSAALTPTAPFSIDQPIWPFDALPTSWQLAIRFQSDAGDTVRYVLVPPFTGEILFPRYDGQTLQPGAVVEIWAVNGQASAIVTAIVLTLGHLTRPDTYQVLNGSTTVTGNNTNL